MTAWLIASAALSLLSAVVAIACLSRVLTLPTQVHVARRIAELLESFDLLTGDQKSLRAQFSRLDNDVEEHLHQATTRSKRAATAEANAKRRRQGGGPADNPEELTLEQQFEMSEQQNWNS